MKTILQSLTAVANFRLGPYRSCLLIFFIHSISSIPQQSVAPVYVYKNVYAHDPEHACVGDTGCVRQDL